MSTFDQWVTPDSILGFAGASLAVVVVSTTVQKLTKKNWIVVPFIVSLIVVFAAALKANTLADPFAWIVTLVNACLLFCTATGANELAAQRPVGGITPQGGQKGKLFVSWFR